MALTLTPRFVAKLQPTPQRIVDVWDAYMTGLGVRVFPSGAKTWSLRYRVGHQLRRMTLGSVDVLSLADAREAARDALKKVAAGHDPALEKQERREADTVGEFAKTYLEKYAKPRKKSWKVDQMRMQQDILPHWRNRLMKDVTRRDVRELLDGIAARPAPIVANRTRSLLHKFFRVAIQFDVVASNPVADTERPGVEKARDRVLTADEVRTFWQTCDRLSPEMSGFYRLRLLTAQRGGEVASMRWGDVDLEQGWWTIPGTVTKNKLPHRVPLSAPVLRILQELRANADDRLKTQKRPKQPAFVLQGARGKRQQAAAFATFSIGDFRGHDLRRTAASMMASGGVPRLTISKILNHVEHGVTKVYDRHSYDLEKQAALDWWAARLDRILKNQEAEKVLPFAQRA
jgi:integrase